MHKSVLHTSVVFSVWLLKHEWWKDWILTQHPAERDFPHYNYIENGLLDYNTKNAKIYAYI